jgi:hypothetical protein
MYAAGCSLVGGLVGARERDDDLAVPRGLLAAHDREVAVEDAGIDHRVALHAQDELLASAGERLRDGDVLLDVLLGEQRPARGDLADERQPVDVGRAPALGLRVPAELQRTRLGRVALDQAGALEVREVRVHRGRRGEPDRLSDLAHRRRVAVLVDVVGQELPDLLLASGQHRVSWVGSGNERMFDTEGSRPPGRRQDARS